MIGSVLWYPGTQGAGEGILSFENDIRHPKKNLIQYNNYYSLNYHCTYWDKVQESSLFAKAIFDTWLK